ncbi:DMT family transporter [Niallia endozanthoxylica]|uniref:DMT family transporter n=1 Tax=Niallia endozanthoxylica TaxID=2036016 RepID=A0A5J5HQI9_9BACI|nr:DMT family transporter [Niallia endozanthoxylica]KAA9021779.1 DMT family transporter [Niallia endozanthoxylica]
MNSNRMRGEFFLAITGLIWGTSFVAQRVGMDYIGPFTFTATRFLIGTLSLIPIILIMGRLNSKKQNVMKQNGTKKDLLIGGLACGIALFFGISFQQSGLVYTTAGKAGFITALYIVLVPLFGLFLHKKVSKSVWIGVALAVVGLYLLCMTEGFVISKGDVIVLCGTVFWAIHILVVDHFASKVDGLKMSFIQFFVAAILSLVVALFAETIELASILASAGPILYTGIVVVGIAYTFQILGQRETNPTVAAIILSMESVFAVISGMILLGESMTLREILGCVIMFMAVIIAQLPAKERAKTKVKKKVI